MLLLFERLYIQPDELSELIETSEESGCDKKGWRCCKKKQSIFKELLEIFHGTESVKKKWILEADPDLERSMTTHEDIEERLGPYYLFI